MSTATAQTQTRVASRAAPTEETIPAKVRAYLARLTERCGSVDNAAWTFASQPEHLLAYAMGDETLFDLPKP